jgi:hypothetical protein
VPRTVEAGGGQGAVGRGMSLCASAWLRNMIEETNLGTGTGIDGFET